MAFTLRDISIVLGEKINRLRPWVSLGYVKPSMRQANSRGETNLFSRSDLYRFAILKRLVEQGWSRDTVGKMISAINEDTFWRIVRAWQNEWKFLEGYYAQKDLTKDLIPIITDSEISPENVSAYNEAFREIVLQKLSERIPDRKVYLLFLMLLPVKIHCIPICENPPLYGDKPLMEDLSKVAEYVTKVPETYMVDVGEIMRKVDDILYIAYPQAFRSEFMAIMRDMFGFEKWNQQLIEKTQEILEASRESGK